MTDLDLNDVALLVRVVRAGSFTAAARERGVPVSTVSRHIARLESRLAVRLLERTTRRLRLTDAGTTYVEHAERALDELAQGGARLRELQEEPRGRVRMTAPVALGGVVARAVAPWLRANPQVSLEIDLTERRVDLIGEGFDVALRAGDVDSIDLAGRKLWSATYQLFASPEYLASRRPPRTLADLRSHDCIALRSAEAGVTWILQRGRKRERVTLKPRIVVNELQAAKEATAAGLGIALLPTKSCGPELAAGGIRRVLPAYEGAHGGMWLVYPARRSLTAAVRSFIAHLSTALSDVPPP